MLLLYIAFGLFGVRQSEELLLSMLVAFISSWVLCIFFAFTSLVPVSKLIFYEYCGRARLIYNINLLLIIVLGYNIRQLTPLSDLLITEDASLLRLFDLMIPALVATLYSLGISAQLDEFPGVIMSLSAGVMKPLLTVLTLIWLQIPMLRAVLSGMTASFLILSLAMYVICMRGFGREALSENAMRYSISVLKDSSKRCRTMLSSTRRRMQDLLSGRLA
jgi:hypothetical protein